MSTSRLSGNRKVVADYSSEDEEREPAVEKMKNSLPLSHHKDQDKHRRDQRDKISSHKRIRKDESSSDESYNRKHRRGSKKHRVHAEDSRRYRVHEDRENCILYDDRTETQMEKYQQDSDSSDNEKRYSRRETQKSRYQSKDRMCSDDDQDERYEQRRVSRHDYSNINNNRREIERNMPSNNNDCDKRKEKDRYKDSSDSDGYHKRDVNRFKEYSSDKGDKKYSKRGDRLETSRSKYYENESDYERSKRSQTHKNYYQQDDSDFHNRSGRQDKQNNDSDYCDRRDIRYMQETGYYFNHEESDYDERRRRIGKNSTELDDDENESSRRKDKHHVHKAKAWSSDDGGNENNDQNIRKDLKKKKHYKDDGSSRERRKDKRSLQKSGIYQHDSDGHCKINEREQIEKNKQQRNNDAARTDYTIKELQKGSHQCDSENYYDKRQMEISGLPDDNGRNYSRQRNKKPIKENKDPDDSEHIDMNCLKDGVKSRQDTCRWDSDQDKRDNRRKSQKKNKNNDEYDRKADEKHSTSGRSKNEKKKSGITEKEISSEIVLRKETVKQKDSRDNGRKNKNNESELQNREIEEKENTRSEKLDSNENIKKKQNMDDILTRTGGAYIPPAKLRAMQEKITDKSSINYQRIAWEALKKSINGLINKVNVSNLKIIISELFKENLVRAKGILARSIMRAQAASPTFTHVYAALVTVINSKFPHIGELIIKRLIIQFRRSFRRNDKQACLACTNFLAHLVNQQTAHEVLALEILTLLLESPTDDSVELAVGFLKECGLRLSEATRSGIDAVFERLRTILHDGEVDKRVQYMIEVMFAVRKDKFKDHPTVIEALDLVEEEDQFTHLITLEDTIDPEDKLNVFRFDPEYEANEAKYEEIKKAMLESSDSEEENSDEEGNNDNDEEDENEMETQTIIDTTETNLTSLRRTIYLTIQSSLDFEECAHKLLKLELKPGQIVELCYMILDCCAQQRTYEKFFGLLAQRFCQINKIYVEPFEDIFKTAYDTIHRFETNKLRNVARFFAHLFYTDAISWQILSHIKLNEDETTSSSRIFVKILFQELCEYMGLLKLNERVKDPTMQEAFEGLFPRDSPRNTRFAINFFTSIGLGGLTDELREHLKNAPKAVFPSAIPLTANNDDSQNSSEEERSKEDKDSSSSDSSSEEEETRVKKPKRSKTKKRKSKEKKKKAKKSKQSKKSN